MSKCHSSVGEWGGSLGDETILSLYSRNYFLNILAVYMGNFRISSVDRGDNLASWKENVMSLSVHVTLWRGGSGWMCLAIVFKPTGLIRPFSCLLGKIFKWCIHSLRRQKKMIVFWEILLLGIHLSRIFFRKQPLVIGTSQSAFSTKHFRTLVDK